MKTSKILSVMAAVATVISCNEKGSEEPVAAVNAEVTAVKVSGWVKGDAISLNGTSSYALESVGDDASTAVFKFRDESAYPYKAAFPVSVWKDENTVTLPAVQKDIPVAAYAESGNLHFGNVCALLKVQLTRGADKDWINYIEFKGNNGEQVSGNFTMDYETLSISPASGTVSDEDKVVRRQVKRPLSADGVTEILIAIPAGTYSKGYTLTVMDEAGHSIEKVVSEGLTVARDEVKAVEAFAFELEKEEGKMIEISTAEELVSFANNYNSNIYENPEVKLTDDIVFDETTSLTFVSIGTEDNLFKGTFDGNGKTIKNYTGTMPIFNTIAADGAVSDITFDLSCKFEVVCSGEERIFAPLALQNYGTITNCHSNAVINVSGSNDMMTRIGGLVMRCRGTGKIENCSFGGTITTVVDFEAQADIQIGGIAALTDGGFLIKNTVFKGHIIHDGCTDDGHTAYIGGIASYARGGIIENCTVEAAETHRIHAGRVDLRAKKENMYVGGIAGTAVTHDGKRIEIKNSRNDGDIYVGIRKAQTTCYLGGIAGNTEGQTIGCSNTGDIALQTYSTNVYMGGVLGNAGSAANITNCTNEGIVATDNTYVYSESEVGFNRAAIGGVCGENHTPDVSGIGNSGNMLIGSGKFVDNATVGIGGLIGINYADIAASPEMVNSGKVEVTITGTTGNIYIGGAVGYSRRNTITGVGSTTQPVIPTGVSWPQVGDVIGAPKL